MCFLAFPDQLADSRYFERLQISKLFNVYLIQYGQYFPFLYFPATSLACMLVKKFHKMRNSENIASEWVITNAYILIIYNLFHAIHATVTNFYVVLIKYFSKFMTFSTRFSFLMLILTVCYKVVYNSWYVFRVRCQWTFLWLVLIIFFTSRFP